MSTDYNYDEQGQFFPFFILTISGLVTLPLTYLLLKPSEKLESTAPRIKSDFKPDHADLIQRQKAKQRRRERRLKRFLATVAGYLMMGWMVYLIIVTARITPKIYDPYDILSISRSADERAIKSRFRKLTQLFHPDKVRPSENQTLDDITNNYVELSKAYKALTDEEVRNNYLQYGHPDGKQSFSIGIALPKFMVTEGNGKYVLLVYGALLGVLLPYIVGKWWYGTQRVTKEKVLIASAGNLFREWSDEITDGGVIGALSSGEEFKSVLKGNKAEAGLEKVEKAILAQQQPASTVAGLTLKDRRKLEDLDGPRRKTLALLWAYLGRIDLNDTTLNKEKYEIAPYALLMNDAFVAICLAYGLLLPLLNAFGAAQHIIQAIPPKASPLLQLPHITPSIAQAIEGPDTKDHLTVQQFMDMPEYQRRKLATDQRGVLSPQQYNDAVAVARQIPLVKVEKAFFKCQGEKYITTGSLVQFVVKARVIPPGTANIPEVTPDQLEDIDPDEEDLDAMLGRKKPKIKGSKDADAIEKEVQPPLAYAPYFARDHSPRWHLFLADGKQNRIAVPPNPITTFDKLIFHESGHPTFNVQTIKMQFQAPPQPGSYTFQMHLVCDSYIGMDTKMEATLVVEDSTKAVEMESEEEISEPDEDSLAGQMNVFKAGGLSGMAAPPKKKKTRAAVESDDESDTEGEGDDTSETDTDTDTDEE